MINLSEETNGKLNDTPDSDDSDKTAPSPWKKIINTNGVLNVPQFLLIMVLTMAAMALVQVENTAIFKHEKNLRMYFNLKLLKLTNNGLYENDDNQD